VVNNQDGTLRLGAALALGELWYQPSAIDGTSKGHFHSQKLALIGTWQARVGWYVDAIIMPGKFNGDVSTSTRGKTEGLNGNALSLSVETGYPISLGWQQLMVEPEMQFVYQHLGAGQCTDVDASSSVSAALIRACSASGRGWRDRSPDQTGCCSRLI
jgi:autotransporter family porin